MNLDYIEWPEISLVVLHKPNTHAFLFDGGCDYIKIFYSEIVSLVSYYLETYGTLDIFAKVVTTSFKKYFAYYTFSYIYTERLQITNIFFKVYMGCK